MRPEKVDVFLTADRPRPQALEIVVIQVRRHAAGLCLPCPSDACKLPFDVVAAVVTELDEVVKVTAHGPCPECAEDRPLVRL